MVKDRNVPGAVTETATEVATLARGLREHFRRGAAHRHAVAYVEGLLGAVERKNGWQVAEYGALATGDVPNPLPEQPFQVLASCD